MQHSQVSNALIIQMKKKKEETIYGYYKHIDRNSIGSPIMLHKYLLHVVKKKNL